MDEVYVNIFRREVDNKQFMETKHKENGYIIYRQYVSDDGVIFRKVFEVRSPRPYKLGQRCDGTIDSVVLALFTDWCKAKGLDAIKLLKQAYPNDGWKSENLKFIRIKALWEGYIRPSKWDVKAEAGLLKSLTEINYHSLVDVVSNYMDGRALEVFCKG